MPVFNSWVDGHIPPHSAAIVNTDRQGGSIGRQKVRPSSRWLQSASNPTKSSPTPRSPAILKIYQAKHHQVPRFLNISLKIMFAIRSLPTNACRRSLPLSSYIIREIAPFTGANFYSSTTTIHNTNINNNDDDSDFLTGTVKFYIRKKAYGFIIPDNPTEAGTSEVWVHRTSIDTPHSGEEYPTRPYLYKDERVKFRVEFEEEGGRTPKATNLTFENGKEVPLFRKNYHQSAIKGEHQRLGEFLLEIMKEEGLSADEQLEKIKTAVQATEEVIAAAERNQQLYGPPPTTADGQD